MNTQTIDSGSHTQHKTKRKKTAAVEEALAIRKDEWEWVEWDTVKATTGKSLKRA